MGNLFAISKENTLYYFKRKSFVILMLLIVNFKFILKDYIDKKDLLFSLALLI